MDEDSFEEHENAQSQEKEKLDFGLVLKTYKVFLTGTPEERDELFYRMYSEKNYREFDLGEQLSKVDRGIPAIILKILGDLYPGFKKAAYVGAGALMGYQTIDIGFGLKNTSLIGAIRKKIQGDKGESLENLIKVSDSTFEEQVLNAELPVLVDFGAKWCPPCCMMGPAFKDSSEEYNGEVIFAKYDLDDPDGRAVADEYFAERGISTIPALILFREGKIVADSIGYTGKDALEEEIKRMVEQSDMAL